MPQNLPSITKIRKRSGEIVKFDLSRIEKAIDKAFQEVGQETNGFAKKISLQVELHLKRMKKFSDEKNFIPHVEFIQDLVEEELMRNDFPKVAKAYIIYRQKRSDVRKRSLEIPEYVHKLTVESKKYFRNPLSEFIFYRSYSRWIEDEKRRETWIETVGRYLDYMKKNLKDALTDKEYGELREAILNQEIMPSMRLMQFAGKAADRTNACAYNCSYIAPENFQDIAEIMYVSMCGTGVGWAVESQNVEKFPQILSQSGKKPSTFVVPDSKEGWSDALALGMKTWAAGEDIEFDYSQLRPAGARLKTMGGKSSGPEPLRQLLDFTRKKMLNRQGRRLRNIDLHDIICMIGYCVVSGGVRRSAMISLSDLDDDDIRDAKKGQFYLVESQRSLANNSAVYLKKPTNQEFLDEWIALMKSGSGERGIFNRGSLVKTLPKRRLDLLAEKPGYFDAYGNMVGQMGTNPCGEIILQSKQFCNLTEVVARYDDTEESLLRKVRLAAILGTYQSTLTYFPYLSKDWKKNCEAERLLGVSVTGQWDSKISRQAEVLEKLKKESIKVNKEYAKRFKIQPSTSVTCVKPSGTVSQLVDCASGMHARYSPYYIRRVRISATDSLFKMLRDQGIPHKPEVGQSYEEATTFVFEFPVKAPKGAICGDDLSALEQLEHWKKVKLNFTEHNPSVTITVSDNEWVGVANWVYENWDIIGGLSFLPRTNHVYELAPYEEINEKRYEELLEKYKNMDFSQIITYEKQDETEVKKELACAGGACEIN
ncbi:ribonucleoside-triphosphate reductase [Candidatus Falkowbacteria bacterium]|nr:ATP cone domain-containing protein [Patescibacteria group bacterium]MDD3434980.1 ATP cone domain-containing protein [Patescibacteria group bacterium]MDD4466350.1 ATP cone domain-containing protein [Patescibacteria group bacterium]NCU42927.1 ribonucleoside-triphosphate reductase [Candidatus Falkowbacteria bacterium]